MHLPSLHTTPKHRRAGLRIFGRADEKMPEKFFSPEYHFFLTTKKNKKNAHAFLKTKNKEKRPRLPDNQKKIKKNAHVHNV